MPTLPHSWKQRATPRPGFSLPHSEAGAANDHEQAEPDHNGETAGQQAKALGGMNLFIPCKATKAIRVIFIQRIAMILLR